MPPPPSPHHTPTQTLLLMQTTPMPGPMPGLLPTAKQVSLDAPTPCPHPHVPTMCFPLAERSQIIDTKSVINTLACLALLPGHAYD